MNAEAEGRRAAVEFRRTHHLGTQPLGDLVALIEQTTGNDVAVVDVGPDEHGLSMRDRARGVVFIAVARTRHPMRQRSTLAHELAHVVFEDWTDDPHTGTARRHRHEIRADAFARHLLVPVEGVREVVGEHPAAVGALSRIVQLFGVSPAMAAIAMHQGGCIDTETKSIWMAMTTAEVAARFGWIDHYEALRAQSDTRRAPQKLLARAIEGYVENVVSAQTLATLRGVDADEVVRGLSAEGITPRSREVDWAAAADLPAVEVDFGEWDDDAGDEGLGG
ncbi:ImmA/IrrE family metallo-endopeptidase [Rhodococcus rhodochrous]|uniref:Toxin-antitoxin system, toxin component n=1 Tax=Rhodococcus rhodochrous KG-21 TaxID=1441923 RepID=A0A0M8PJ00_RHORH|nr:ImmA/IrrE family metallo-endopeptidase [Rhodococcus rhodochrous]KOS53159.1 toxin-antitoxin system, toxin component [Rhodococcus rhodochrous KG-21]